MSIASHSKFILLLLSFPSHNRVVRLRNFLFGRDSSDSSIKSYISYFDKRTEDHYGIFSPIRLRKSFAETKGFLNSVLRHLPIHAPVVKESVADDTPSSRYQESWKRISCDDISIATSTGNACKNPNNTIIKRCVSNQETTGVTASSSTTSSSSHDSDESLTHIYSSICESTASGGGGNQSKKPKRSRLKRATTIPKTLRFLMMRRKTTTTISS